MSSFAFIASLAVVPAVPVAGLATGNQVDLVSDQQPPIQVKDPNPPLVDPDAPLPVIEYSNIAHYIGAAGSAGTWEAVLYGSGAILIQFQDAGTETGSSSTTGIEGPAGTAGLSYGTCNTAGSVAASGAGLFLQAWIDFNADGDWGDAGEQIFADQALAAGVNSLAFMVPASATSLVTTFGRFRACSDPGLGYAGPAPNGEVEDYEIATVPVTLQSLSIDQDPPPTESTNGAPAGAPFFAT
jgi:hypothetical protein